ncbi:hypothetical protein GALMADRAFT_256080, partial [Galerina marginata CBS 339.88]
MKQYKFDVISNGNVETTLPLSDGHSFVFSFSASEYRNAQKIGINLYYKDSYIYCATISPTQNLQDTNSYDNVQYQYVYQDGDGAKFLRYLTWNHTNRHFGRDDRNIVIRIDKTAPNSFITYINDERAFKSSSITLTNNDIGRVDAAGVVIETKDALAARLYVFQYTERERSERFATTMRNPERSNEDELVHALSMEDMEVVAADPETLSTAGNRAHEAHLGGDGANAAHLPSGPSALPPDADIIRLSSTMAWPRAVYHVLGAGGQAEVQQRHDALMNEWIKVVRGNNAVSSTYFYFEHVYSHGVVWPKVILERVSDHNFLKVREKHVERIAVLEDGLNALR